MEQFYIGWHQPRNGPSGCAIFPHCMISVNRLINRRSPFPVQSWILDSGAFTRISQGRGHLSTRRYAKEIRRWASNGNLLAAVSQDYMCEPFILKATGLTVAQHQAATVARYDTLKQLLGNDGPYLMPVLQGFIAADYLSHIELYEERLAPGMWVGVGSVCKRQGRPAAIREILMAIHQARPDIRLHGFGVKITSLKDPIIWDLLYSADSMAPSYHARRNPDKGYSSNDPRAALAYAQRITAPAQGTIFNLG